MKYILTFGLICLSLMLTATPVSRTQALQAATNWTDKWAPKDFNAGTITKEIAISEAGETYLYLFQYANGFVLTSADDSSIPIIAYGYDTNIPETQDNPAFKAYLDCRKQEIQQIISQRANNDVTSEAWRSLLANNFPRNDTRSIAPLLSTKWNQGWPYNMYCPVDAAGSGGHVYAGCVASAMAQVMKYWNWPITGVGSHSFYADGYGNQSVNFEQTTYNWNQMPYRMGPEDTEIAKLMYHLGVSVDMGYAPDGSGAYSDDAVEALISHFRYTNGIQLIEKQGYSASEWNQMLKTELDSARPLYYHGFGNGGGHAFVCDGYQASDYFHFNWGWGGNSDGYFYTNSLNPGTEFNWGQGAMFNVYPLNYNISMIQLALTSQNCQAGDDITVDISSYPVLPDWNINTVSFELSFDNNSMIYMGLDTTGTMLEGAIIETSDIQPGRIGFTVTTTNPLVGGGNLLRLNFQPILPGTFSFNLHSFTYNTTTVTTITPTSITVTAQVYEPQYSVIDVLNAIHISYNEIATMPITTTYILRSWNLHNISFEINYQPDKVSWDGYDTTGCLAENAIIVTDNAIPGRVSFNLSYSDILIGSGNLLKLNFRAIGNASSPSMATITPTNFYMADTAVQNLQPGYILLTSVTANEDEVSIPENKLTIAPNPFKSNTALNLALTKENQSTVISVYNIKGQMIKNIFNGVVKGSKMAIDWDGKDEQGSETKAGIYFIKVKTDRQIVTKKVYKQ